MQTDNNTDKIQTVYEVTLSDGTATCNAGLYINPLQAYHRANALADMHGMNTVRSEASAVHERVNEDPDCEQWAIVRIEERPLHL